MRGCDPGCGPPASGRDPRKIDKPNPISLPSGAWQSVTIKYPAVVVCTGTDPGGDLIAVPEMEKSSTTEVYTSIGTGSARVLYLHAPGIWRIRNTGATGITALVLDTYDAIAALFYGGVKIGGGTVSTGAPAPGTFTDASADQVTVGTAEGQVLAAGSYKHLFFKNTSLGGQTITIRGNGTTAVSLKGWVLGPDALGDGGVVQWNHPDVMPAGAFRAVSDAAGGKLTFVAGS